MAGIYGAFLNLKPSIDSFQLSIENPTTDKISFSNGFLGRAVLPKLFEDRFFKTRDNITICFEGINLSDKIDSFEKFFSAYRQNGISFIDDLKGTFSGFIFDENQEKLYVFNDHLSSRNIFYYYDKEIGFVFSSELYSLSKFLKNENITYSLNQDAAYMMALYGFILEDQTYINEVKKLPYSSLITYDLKNKAFEIKKRFTYSTKEKELSYEDGLAKINHLFESSVKNNWEKDLEYTSKHISLISGGLDAKTNILVALKMGFQNITSITFGQSDSVDVKYANKVAASEKLNHYHRFLENPDYLLDNIMKNYIIPVDGLMMFHTSAHLSSTVRQFNLENFHTIHSGQMGGEIMGGWAIEHFDFFKKKQSIGYTGFVSNPKLLDKIKSLPEILSRYQDLGFDHYAIEQRLINANLVGDRSLGNHIDTISPFFDLDLINTCLGIPLNKKGGRRMYYDWLKKYHPEVLQYPYEKIYMKPNTKIKMVYGHFFKKYYNGAKKYFNLKYDSMNPYNQWLREDPTFLKKMDFILETEIDKPYISEEFRKDLKEIYANDIFEFRNKFAVLTTLLSLKLYFDQ